MIRKSLALAVTLIAAPAWAGSAGRLDLGSAPHLAAKASDTTDITLPGALFSLGAALDPKDAEAREVLKHLESIRIRSYTFDTEHAYSDADVAPIAHQLTGSQWSPIVHTHDHKDGERADVYICLDNQTACGLAVVVTGPKEFTVVNLVGRVPLEQVDAITRELHVSGGTSKH